MPTFSRFDRAIDEIVAFGTAIRSETIHPDDFNACADAIRQIEEIIGEHPEVAPEAAYVWENLVARLDDWSWTNVRIVQGAQVDGASNSWSPTGAPGRVLYAEDHSMKVFDPDLSITSPPWVFCAPSDLNAEEDTGAVRCLPSDVRKRGFRLVPTFHTPAGAVGAASWTVVSYGTGAYQVHSDWVNAWHRVGAPGTDVDYVWFRPAVGVGAFAAGSFGGGTCHIWNYGKFLWDWDLDWYRTAPIVAAGAVWDTEPLTPTPTSPTHDAGACWRVELSSGLDSSGLNVGNPSGDWAQFDEAAAMNWEVGGITASIDNNPTHAFIAFGGRGWLAPVELTADSVLWSALKLETDGFPT